MNHIKETLEQSKARTATLVSGINQNIIQSWSEKEILYVDAYFAFSDVFAPFCMQVTIFHAFVVRVTAWLCLGYGLGLSLMSQCLMMTSGMSDIRSISSKRLIRILFFSVLRIPAAKPRRL